MHGVFHEALNCKKLRMLLVAQSKCAVLNVGSTRLQDVNYEPYRRFMLSTLTQQNVSSQEALPSPVEPGPEEREQVTQLTLLGICIIPQPHQSVMASDDLPI
jgi:hypothetical protein